MYIAMNRFRVIKDEEAAFEALWLNREIHLAREPGFVEFHMLRGPERDDHTLYASHTIWASEEDFLAWTRSQGSRPIAWCMNPPRAEPLRSAAGGGRGVLLTVHRRSLGDGLGRQTRRPGETDDDRSKRRPLRVNRV